MVYLENMFQTQLRLFSEVFFLKEQKKKKKRSNYFEPKLYV